VVGVDEHTTRTQNGADLGVQGGQAMLVDPVQRGRRQDRVVRGSGELAGPGGVAQIGRDHGRPLVHTGPGDAEQDRVDVHERGRRARKSTEGPQRDRAGATGQIEDGGRPVRVGGRDDVEHGREAVFPVGHV
jgi:hypothetical protein